MLNPLRARGADPSVLRYNGWFYYTQTTFRDISIWRVRDLAYLRKARRVVVWLPPADTPHSRNLWAPELHRLENRWYIYYAADNGHNRNHRMFAIVSDAEDPMKKEWRFAGELLTPEGRWAIDGTVLRYNRQLHFLWSGWEGVENGQQNIYMARMKDPLTLEGPRVRISTPEYRWERHGALRRPGPDDKPFIAVNEGPAVLVRDGRVLVTYSASGSWTEHYCVGMIWAEAGADLLNPASWRKHSEPVFTACGSESAGTHAAGHNSFFQSHDGTEDWIMYHANQDPGARGWGNRSPRAQRFTWDASGFPVFGRPLPLWAIAAQPVECPQHAHPGQAASSIQSFS